MEPNTISNICQTCHQPILPTYYFCPNCGAKLVTAPLPTTFSAQLGIYIFSIILPAICFLFITRWPGLKYIKSTDSKAKWVGVIALLLLVISTVTIGWLAYAWTQELAKSINDSLNAVNMDLGNLQF